MKRFIIAIDQWIILVTIIIGQISTSKLQTLRNNNDGTAILDLDNDEFFSLLGYRFIEDTYVDSSNNGNTQGSQVYTLIYSNP